MFHRYWLALSLLVFPIFSEAEEWQGSEVDYGGLTIYCKWGCGDEADPSMKQIWRILEPAVWEIFGKQKRLILDQWMNEHLTVPWISGDFDFNVYDWQKIKIPWTEKNRKSFSIWSHESFLDLAARLQSDLHY